MASFLRILAQSRFLVPEKYGLVLLLVALSAQYSVTCIKEEDLTLEQRQSPRYRMQLPMLIVQVGSHRVSRHEQTRDVSSSGVSFLSKAQMETGGRIEYLITLSTNNPPVRIRCLGKVIRSVKQVEPEGVFEVAVSMDRYQFMSQVELLSFAAAV